MRRPLFIAVLAVTAGTIAALAGETGGTGTAITPAEALAVPDSSGTVSVRGHLKNAGTNYFTDNRLVLTGKDQHGQINVQPWLPAKAALPLGTGNPRRPVQSDYLDKEVVLTGQLKVRPVKGVGITKVLVVEKADVLAQ